MKLKIAFKIIRRQTVHFPMRTHGVVKFNVICYPLSILCSGQPSDSELFLFYASPVRTQRFATFVSDIFSLLQFSDPGKIPQFGERFSGNSLHQEVADHLMGERFSTKTHFQNDLCFLCDFLNSPNGEF